MLSFAVIVNNICWITDFPCLGCVSYFASKITNLVPSLSYLSFQQFVFCVTPLLRYESNCPLQRYSFYIPALESFSVLIPAIRWENWWDILHFCRKSGSNTDLSKEETKKRKKGNRKSLCEFSFNKIPRYFPLIAVSVIVYLNLLSAANWLKRLFFYLESKLSFLTIARKAGD